MTSLKRDVRYPRKQTSVSAFGTSAMCHRRTQQLHSITSSAPAPRHVLPSGRGPHLTTSLKGKCACASQQNQTLMSECLRCYSGTEIGLPIVPLDIKGSRIFPYRQSRSMKYPWLVAIAILPSVG